MYGGGSFPPGGSGLGSGVKAFFLFVLLFLGLIAFAVSGLANVDLTGNNGTASASVASTGSNPQVITIQNPTTANYQVPVTGSCTNPYTVQSGDYLSQIATICNTTTAAILSANPQITDPNLIYPGQVLTIPSSSAPQQTPVPVTGNSNEAIPQQTTVPTSVPTAATPSATMTIPQQVQPQVASNGLPILPPGTPLQVKARNFPPNKPVNIAVGPQSAGYNVISVGITDASGNLVSNITVPTAQNATTPYVVVVATIENPVIEAMSQPFYIGGTSQTQ